MTKTVFISAAPEDHTFARQLARFLQRQGVSVWLDRWQSGPEDAWESSSRHALQNCTYFVVIFSAPALDSWLVRDQTRLALQLEKPVVPVLAEPRRLPPFLRDVPAFDLSSSGLRFRSEVCRLHRYLAGRPDVALADLNRLHVAVGWERLRGQPQLLWPLLVAALLLLWIGFAGWPLDRSEPVRNPRQVQPVSLSEPLAVPDDDVLPLPNPEPTPVDIDVRPKDGKVMVFVPAGDFLRGSAAADPEANEDELPQRLIYLDAFWIDKTEISNAQYGTCVAEGACTPPSVRRRAFQDAQAPVVGVDWEQAAAYCRWAGARLPSEAEWEKAARGTAGRLYPWGNRFDGRRLNYCDTNCMADWRDRSVDDGYRLTAPVGLYPGGASPYGALNMAGNVWEWTADWYDPEAYVTAPYRNPTGPAEGRQRVIRGGSWLVVPNSVRTARRHKEIPTYGYDNIGFRCAMPAGGS